jgi:hypothetical protein
MQAPINVWSLSISILTFGFIDGLQLGVSRPSKTTMARHIMYFDKGSKDR